MIYTPEELVTAKRKVREEAGRGKDGREGRMEREGIEWERGERVERGDRVGRKRRVKRERERWQSGKGREDWRNGVCKGKVIRKKSREGERKRKVLGNDGEGGRPVGLLRWRERRDEVYKK